MSISSEGVPRGCRCRARGAEERKGEREAPRARDVATIELSSTRDEVAETDDDDDDEEDDDDRRPKK